jgi:hypothetical protein
LVGIALEGELSPG